MGLTNIRTEVFGVEDFDGQVGVDLADDLDDVAVGEMGFLRVHEEVSVSSKSRAVPSCWCVSGYEKEGAVCTSSACCPPRNLDDLLWDERRPVHGKHTLVSKTLTGPSESIDA